MADCETLLNLKLGDSVVTRDGYDSLSARLGSKVAAVEGKGLSTNDFTDEYKQRVDRLSGGGLVSVTVNGKAASGDDGNVEVTVDASDIKFGEDQTVAEALDGKVDAEDGKGLSTNDFTDEYKNRVDRGALGSVKFNDVESTIDPGDTAKAVLKVYARDIKLDAGSDKSLVDVIDDFVVTLNGEEVARTDIMVGSVSRRGYPLQEADPVFAAWKGSTEPTVGAGAKPQGEGTVAFAAADFSKVYLDAAGEHPKTLASLIEGYIVGGAIGWGFVEASPGSTSLSLAPYSVNVVYEASGTLEIELPGGSSRLQETILRLTDVKDGFKLVWPAGVGFEVSPANSFVPADAVSGLDPDESSLRDVVTALQAGSAGPSVLLSVFEPGATYEFRFRARTLSGDRYLVEKRKVEPADLNVVETLADLAGAFGLAPETSTADMVAGAAGVDKSTVSANGILYGRAQENFT